MGMIPVSDEVQLLVERAVAEGRAESVEAFVDAAVLCWALSEEMPEAARIARLVAEGDATGEAEEEASVVLDRLEAKYAEAAEESAQGFD
jgi:hypothetical protein